MASYFVPIKRFALPKLDLVLYRSDGGFRHFSFLISVALGALAVAFTYLSLLAFAFAPFEPWYLATFYEVAGTIIFLITWMAYLYFLCKVWMDDGRKKRL